MMMMMVRGNLEVPTILFLTPVACGCGDCVRVFFFLLPLDPSASPELIRHGDIIRLEHKE